MKKTALLIACCVLLFAHLAVAQSTGTTADPLSGTWTGYMARDASDDRQDITLTLKLDGTNVSGTITGPPRPGEIRSGSFDPSTGALKLEIVVQDEEKSIAIFEGRVEEGTATGTVSLKNQTGTFKVTKEPSGFVASPSS